MLRVEAIDTYYGDSQILFGMNLEIGEGEVVTLLGRNGMGKTTTVRSIMGLTPPRTGRIAFAGVEIAGRSPHTVARAGLGLVPEGRQVFPNLSVAENLLATAVNRTARSDPWTIERIYALFPRLAERRGNMGGQLSGGEQQMLAIGRALMTNPRLMILDEATEGLAPLIREEIWGCLAGLRAKGLSILLIDKNVDALLRMADRHVVIEKGRVAWTGDSDAFRADPSVKERFLGI